jgi:site-specific recombinase XerD
MQENIQQTKQISIERQLRTPTLADAVDTFVRLELELNDRPKTTIRWYRLRLDAMSAHLGPELPPYQVMDVDLLEFMSVLKRRKYRYENAPRPKEEGGLSVDTLRGYAKALRRFWAWMKRKKFIEDDPAIDLPVPGKRKVAKRGISDADQDAMIAASRPTWDGGPLSEDDIRSFRDYAILCFLDSTGCRLGGLAHMTLRDIDLDNPDKKLRKRAYVVEKGDKGRYVFMNERTQAAMKAWLCVRPAAASENVFLGYTRKYSRWKPLVENGIYTVVKKFAISTGVAAKLGSLWSPHQWRHRFGRRWLERGGDLSRLAQLMGHSTVQITSEHYGQLEIDALQDGYDQIMGG